MNQRNELADAATKMDIKFIATFFVLLLIFNGVFLEEDDPADDIDWREIADCQMLDWATDTCVESIHYNDYHISK